jgi:hypothetical protein
MYRSPCLEIGICFCDRLHNWTQRARPTRLVGFYNVRPEQSEYSFLNHIVMLFNIDWILVKVQFTEASELPSVSPGGR